MRAQVVSDTRDLLFFDDDFLSARRAHDDRLQHQWDIPALAFGDDVADALAHLYPLEFGNIPREQHLDRVHAHANRFGYRSRQAMRAGAVQLAKIIVCIDRKHSRQLRIPSKELLGLFDLARRHHEAGNVIIGPGGKRRGRGFQTFDPVENQAVVNGHDDRHAITGKGTTQTIFHRHLLNPICLGTRPSWAPLFSFVTLYGLYVHGE